MASATRVFLLSYLLCPQTSMLQIIIFKDGYNYISQLTCSSRTLPIPLLNGGIISLFESGWAWNKLVVIRWDHRG